ncbi:MAG: DUF1565 domain-containing protein [Patescibacteria group bacterium]|nr:DUF1565 domain-containing protein [Patescibacteria group bacterium]
MVKYNIIYLVFISFLIFIVYSLTSKLFEKSLFVSTNGSDNNSGTFGKPLRSIQYAVNIATAGTTIHILPGTYRESVKVSNSGTKDSPITLYVAPSDRGKTVLAGSEPSSEMIWSKCTTNTCSNIPNNSVKHVYFTKLDWRETPYLIHEILSGNKVQELHEARSPNYEVTDLTKFHEHWWTAKDSAVSQHTLIDKEHLKNLSDLTTGANITMVDGGDSRCGVFMYEKKADRFDQAKGEIYFDDPVGFSLYGSQENGIGPYTKYFLYGKPQFLDTPGEWYFDKSSKTLYLWPLENKNPSKLDIEISRRSSGIIIDNASNITISGLTIQYINKFQNIPYETIGAIIINPAQNTSVENIGMDNIRILNSSNGISLIAYNPTSKIKHIRLSNSEIGYIGRNAIMTDGGSNYPSNISNVNIENSSFHDLSFTDFDQGLNFVRTDYITIKNNRIYNIALNGIHMESYERNNLFTSGVHIENNFIYDTCEALSSCSAIKFFGGKFRDTTVDGNTVKDNRGWSYCQEKTNGKGYGYGVFISNASGITVKNNISLNNSTAYVVYPRQIEAYGNKFLNNLSVNSNVGIDLQNPAGVFDYNPSAYHTRHNNSEIINNIFLNDKTGIRIDPANTASVKIDYNAYINNENDMILRNTPLKNVGSIHATVPFWDVHSLDTTPQALKNIEKKDFNLYYTSPLRGKGEPQSGNPWIQANSYLLGLANDIGPCKFSWVGNTCAVNGN